MFDSWPYAATFAVLFAGAMLRSNATYWAGRSLRAGGEHTRFGRHLDRPAVARAEAAVRRLGAPAVTLSFLTVGVQTAVMAAAGALRMPLSRFVPATVVGSLLWAAVYTFAGLAVLRAAIGGLPWWGALLTVLAVAGTLLGATRLARGLRGTT